MDCITARVVKKACLCQLDTIGTTKRYNDVTALHPQASNLVVEKHVRQVDHTCRKEAGMQGWLAFHARLKGACH